MVVAGIDIGFRTAKAVLLDEDRIVAYSIVAAGIDLRDSCERALREALEKAKLSARDVVHITATGTGKNKIPFVDDEVVESFASAQGAVWLFPSAKTVIDVGAEAIKVIACDDKGNVVDFARNEKCAAGAGAFVEAMARALEVEVDEIGPLSLQTQNEVRLDATCVIFAESEVVSLIHAGEPKTDIARSIHDAIATRATSMVRRIGVREDVVIIGGLAKNSGVVDSFKRCLKSTVLLPAEPQIVTALGAAIVAAGKPQRGDRNYSVGVSEVPDFSRRGPSIITLSKGLEKEQTKAPTGFWKWKEYSWKAPGMDWREARSLTAGVDVGSVSSKAVILTDGELFAYNTMRTGSESRNSARTVIDAVIDGTGMTLENFQFIVGTGYGRANVPFAHKTLTEISCHARGANYLGGSSIRTILDMGGQDCKAIRCDEQGKVTSFIMNDKCAAGTGRGMEVMADLLAVPIDQLGPLSLSIDREPPAVSSTCVIFAKSEAMELLRQGWSKAEVLAAFCEAMAHRVVILLQRLGVEREFAVTGGIAKNVGVMQRVEKALAVTAMEIKPDPQIAGAVGAALFARDFLARLGKAG